VGSACSAISDSRLVPGRILLLRRATHRTHSWHGSQWRFSQYQYGDDSNDEKADDLNEHLAGGVNRREAVPVPIGNVGRYRGHDSGDLYEAYSTAETRDVCPSQKEDYQNGLQQFLGEFDPHPFAKSKRASCVVHQNS
jgi:hypothetical protein